MRETNGFRLGNNTKSRHISKCHLNLGILNRHFSWSISKAVGREGEGTVLRYCLIIVESMEIVSCGLMINSSTHTFEYYLTL